MTQLTKMFHAVLFALSFSKTGVLASNEGIHEMMNIQQQYRQHEARSAIESAAEHASRELLYDDDHVYSSAPTENTYGPTPSGTTSYTSTCLSNCSSYDAATWNLDNWCAFYWDAGCYLPDANFLNINPAGKALVSNYSCVPPCLSNQLCGASYCRIFSHLYSSCRTGYALLDFNTTLQDETHEQCMSSFMEENYEAHGIDYHNTSNITTASWEASFTLSPVSLEDLAREGNNSYTAIRSAVAHLLSGVDTSGVTITFIGDISIYAPTFQPTPAPTYTASPTIAAPTLVPTSSPTTNDSVMCSPMERDHWCNDNQAENIILGIANNATHCQSLCNDYVGTTFTTGCCLWYTGNKEPLLETNGCALQPSGTDTPWDDSHFFWMSQCSSVSAEPTPVPTLAPTLGPGQNGSPSPAPTTATPLPTKQPTHFPTFAPTEAPSAHPTDPTAAPTEPPTSPQVGVRVTVQINSTIEGLGFPVKSEIDTYLQLSSELTTAFNSLAFEESLWLASTSLGVNSTLDNAGHDLDTLLRGYDDLTNAPSPSPTTRTPAPTPTTYFDPTNSTLGTDDEDQTGIIAGSTAAGVVGAGAVGAVAYNYASSDLVKVAAEPAEGIEMLSV
jgi:hypothetical protein